MKYVIHTDGCPLLFFAKTLTEAMDTFDKMTKLYNFLMKEDYLTCEEMGIFTIEDFVKEVVNGGTDCVYCDTIEEYCILANESFLELYNETFTIEE